VVSLVPAVLDALLAEEPDWVAPAHLRAVLLGGAATSPRLVARARARGLVVLTTYGLTETSSQVATLAPGEEPVVSRGIVTSGRALPGVELRRGPDGRLWVRGPMLFSGYVGAPGALDRDGFFVTDDLGHLDAKGRLFVTGRLGHRIVTGGENVDPAVVEAALLACNGVEQAIVFGTPDERFGEEVACALVTNPGFDSGRALSDLRKTLLPHERPRRVALVKELPLLPNGKVDRPAARALSLGELTAWTDG
jgi:o-succinylbenzoate---CoA ligase